MNTSSSASRLALPAFAFACRALRLFAPIVLCIAAPLTRAQPSSVTAPHVVTSSDVLVIPAGTEFSYRIFASDAPNSYGAAGLPAGLTLDPSTGIIRGVIGSLSTTPVAVTFRATNVAGTGQAVQMMASNGNPPAELPTASAIVAPTAGTYHAGDTLTFTVKWSAPYGGLAVTGSPRIALTVGGQPRYANFLAVENGSTITFAYTLTDADNGASGVALGDTIDANGGTLQDRTGLPCCLSLPAADTSSIAVAAGPTPANQVAASPPPTASVASTTTESSGTAGVAATPANDPSSTGTQATAVVTSGATAGSDSRIVNLSSRMNLSGTDAVVGFVLKGTANKSMLVRAVGPSLANFGVSNPAPAPTLTLFDHANQVLGANDGWANDAQIATAGTTVGAFGLSSGSHDAAVLRDLAPGAYTAQVSPGGNGVVLLEVYDAATGAPAELANISARGQVGSGDSALVAGFVVAGNASKRLLVRGVGPSLAQFGVTDAVADPVVQIFATGSSDPAAQNDNWEHPVGSGASGADLAATATAVGAFPLNAGGSDAAVLVTLPPGSYTAVVTGANGTTGEGLVEVYDAAGQ